MAEAQAPKVSIEQTQDTLQRYYNITMDLTTVKDFPSYDDQNTYFKSTDGEEFVFKIHELGRSGQTPVILEGQNRCLTHLKTHGIICPDVVKVLHPYTGVYLLSEDKVSDQTSVFCHDSMFTAVPSAYNTPIHGHTHRNKLGRLLRFIRGPMMVDVAQGDGLMYDLGVYMGNVCKALQTFSADECRRVSEWDMAVAHHTISLFKPRLTQPMTLTDEALTKLTQCSNGLSGEDKLALVTALSDEYKAMYDAVEDRLPESIIHGDANDYNIIVDASNPSNPSIASLIDFGELMLTKRVFDLAICIGYMLLDKDDPVHTAACIARGFLSKLQLTPEEVSLVFPSAITRICVSVSLSHVNFQHNPENEYLLVTAKPGWKLLKDIAETYGSLTEANKVFLSKL